MAEGKTDPITLSDAFALRDKLINSFSPDTKAILTGALTKLLESVLEQALKRSVSIDRSTTDNVYAQVELTAEEVTRVLELQNLFSENRDNIQSGDVVNREWVGAELVRVRILELDHKIQANETGEMMGKLPSLLEMFGLDINTCTFDVRSFSNCNAANSNQLAHEAPLTLQSGIGKDALHSKLSTKLSAASPNNHHAILIYGKTTNSDAVRPTLKLILNLVTPTLPTAKE